MTRPARNQHQSPESHAWVRDKRAAYCRRLWQAVSLSLVLILGCFSFGQAQTVTELATEFLNGLSRLPLPVRSFDYQDELRRLPSLPILKQKQGLLNTFQRRLKTIKLTALSLTDQIVLDQLRYELDQQQQQTVLELMFRQNPSQSLPTQGLAGLDNGQAWYAHYVRRYTNTALTADELFTFGREQVSRAQQEIRRLHVQLGYRSDSAAVYRYLASGAFFVSDTQRIFSRYRQLEQTVRGHLGKLFSDTTVGQLGIQSWVGATPAMPPAIYQNGTDRFFINLSTGLYNTRATDWVFLHEGIPGHHYQMSRNPGWINPFQAYHYYLGNLEGWGCYVESLGQTLGLHATAGQALGRWEWELVRSVRVVLDVGIHVRGWTKAQAFAYWKANVVGQDDLAEREINRVMNWPGQCLSYKVGALQIEQMKSRLSQRGLVDQQRFHRAYLTLSSVPLNVVHKYLEAVYKKS